jgi:peptidoglycan/LPS O-acetylase OafA/YrhL
MQRFKYVVLFVVVIVSAVYCIFFSKYHMDLTARLGFVRCFYGFGLGVFAAWFGAGALAGTLSRIRPAILECAAFGSIIALLWFSVDRAGTATVFSCLAPFVFVFSIIVFSREGGPISRFLKMRPLVYMGKISYSIYLTHWLLFLIMCSSVNILMRDSGGIYSVVSVSSQNYFKLRADDASFLTIFGALYFAILIAISSLTFNYIEMKFVKVGARFLNARADAERGMSSSSMPGPRGER